MPLEGPHLTKGAHRTLDGPVIEGKAVGTGDVPEVKVVRILIARAGDHGVSADTVNRAIAKYGELAAGEIIDHAEKQFRRMTKKGESYVAADYLAALLNKGVGQKALVQREKEAQAVQRQAERKAELAAKAAGEKIEAALKSRFDEFRRSQCQALLRVRSDLEIAELGETILGKLPRINSIRDRWQEIHKDARRLDMKSGHDKTIRPLMVGEVLDRWGALEARELEAFRAWELEEA